MNGNELSAEDIGAVIDQGDYLGLLQSLVQPRTEKQPRQEPRHLSGGASSPRTAPPKVRPDGRPVGAWPAGCGRPGDPFPRQLPA